ncbi:hypothetical protein T459_06523 [Capsicum annuum]|uniref:Peptidase M3A/M3B catalytic domain-containing protein n=1 Tax=Capsicum annuum TaxID=4072 RepID=A0A2G3AB26_CAPAN|nr:hypothetical protein T459_06523 [Capsicum annuum]
MSLRCCSWNWAFGLPILEGGIGAITVPNLGCDIILIYLAKLSQKFEENVLDSTKKFEKLMTAKKDIEGLPATALGLAAQTAVSKGYENANVEDGPWIITLDAPSYMSVMKHAKNRTLREEVSMAMKMASVEKVEELLEKLRSASWDPAAKALSSHAACLQEELRPYFLLPRVMDGLFNLVNMLFGINVEPADGLAPVWNHDVRFYCVNDSSGTPIAYFYFDPYSCPSEKSGVGDKPSLMTFREVETVFHEFGHALQHMLTKQDEGLLAGLRGIEWDAMELPSQFMENWCYHRYDDVFAMILEPSILAAKPSNLSTLVSKTNTEDRMFFAIAIFGGPLSVRCA